MPPNDPSPSGRNSTGQADPKLVNSGENMPAPMGEKLSIAKLVHTALVGERGMRAGWSLVLGFGLYRLFLLVLGTIAVTLYPALTTMEFSPAPALVSEGVALLALIGAVLVVGRIEERPILDYNMRSQHPVRRFFTGAGIGFLALSLLVFGITAGGWMRFGPMELSVGQIAAYAALWGVVFLLTGLVEEGLFRGFALFTLTRGINFWWAFAVVSAVCMRLLLTQSRSNGAWGVYLIGVLGLIPCIAMHHMHSSRAGFWQAAWVTSTLFGYWHTSNIGENGVGIFAAALIGFVFCVSIRVTGSVWWAIGCHAAWDWSETFFYGTADSGFAPQGHLLTTLPVGNPLMNGGSNGPEGSVLVIPVLAVILAFLLLFYRRQRPAAAPNPAPARRAF
jgi:uncharacterized protein